MAEPRRLVTRQRTATLRVLTDADAFLTAQELHSRLQRTGVGAGLSTVYRSLEFLVSTGQVDVIRDHDNTARYRICREPDHHHHLRCRACQRSVELIDEEIEAWARKVAKRHRYAAVTHEVELVGECPQCRASAK